MSPSAHAAALTDEQRRRDVGAFFGSLFSTLDHILFADKVWLSRFGACDPPKPHANLAVIPGPTRRGGPCLIS
jgi:uncharacterized damage-inducible protein DinB